MFCFVPPEFCLFSVCLPTSSLPVPSQPPWGIVDPSPQYNGTAPNLLTPRSHIIVAWQCVMDGFKWKLPLAQKREEYQHPDLVLTWCSSCLIFSCRLKTEKQKGTNLITQTFILTSKRKSNLHQVLKNDYLLLWQTAFPPGLSPQTSTFRDPDSTSAAGEDGKACFQ